MQPFITLLLPLLVAVAAELPVSTKTHFPYAQSHWPAKNAKQAAYPKTKTLMVQIRSDHPVPLVFKGRPVPTAHHAHGHYVKLPMATHHAHVHSHMALQRRPRPVKMSAPIYLKAAPIKQMLRQQLKYKMPNVKTHAKPLTSNFEKPYKYEKPVAMAFVDLGNQLPTTTKPNFLTEHFAPIHTIPAPNLALHDNHIHHEEAAIKSKPKTPNYQQLSPSTSNTISNNNINFNYNNHLDNQYEVLEEITNDATFVDPISDSQKLFAPDPDPSLPTTKVRPATEPYNQPSNGKPLPSDLLQPAAQPLVQILGAQQAKLTATNDIYQQQPFISQHLTAIQQSAPLQNYNPTYLVTQSNNLLAQHKQQLFQPHQQSIHPPHLNDDGFNHADLTQEVASDGQILQAARQAQRNRDKAKEQLPQFAALLAAPALGAEHAATQVPQVAPFSLPNVATAEPQGGFVISNYYNNGVPDNSQLLQAYAEEEAQRQLQLRVEHTQAAQELERQQEQQQELLQQQQQLEYEQQQQRHQQQQLQQQQQQQQQQLEYDQQQQQRHQQQQQQQQLEYHQQQQQRHQQQQQQHQLEYEQQQQQRHQQHQLQQQQHQQQLQQLQHSSQAQQHLQSSNHADPAAAAFEEHQRLVQQHLGSNTPLRIFVPDDDEARVQKRSGKEASKKQDA